jgi:AbrB family looped-hinge helix DNA binding protein
MVTVRVDAQGRILLPARVREALGWSAGTTLGAEVEPDGVLTLRSRRALLDGIRAAARPVVDSGYTVDAFLDEKYSRGEHEAGRFESSIP